MILVLEILDELRVSTNAIPDLSEKLEAAFPGIFPEDDDTHAHMCGTGEEEHIFRDEVEMGMTIPHLLEHLILHLTGRSSGFSRGFSGRRSGDIEKGITSHYYVVVHYTDKIQALVAADLAFQVLLMWLEGRTIRLNPDAMLVSINRRLADMLRYSA